MRITSIKGLLSHRYFLNTLEKISDHGTSFAAGTSLLMSLTVRPAAIWATPDTEKENKQYAISNSICSSLVKFGMVEAVAIPVENAVKNIDKNKEKFLKSDTLKDLTIGSYKLGTQIMKLSVGFLTAVPKSVLTVAMIPFIMDYLFNVKKEPQEYQNGKNIPFKGKFTDKLSRQLAKVLNNKSFQNFVIKHEKDDKNIPKHITAATDILLTTTSVVRTNQSREIKDERKKALIYNNIISTGITLGLGYGLDYIMKGKTGKFIEKFSKLNAGNPKLPKYIEGLNILRPALIFAGIYYGLLPIISTYMSEKIDKYVTKQK